jgi:hypothetical protein
MVGVLALVAKGILAATGKVADLGQWSAFVEQAIDLLVAGLTIYGLVVGSVHASRGPLPVPGPDPELPPAPLPPQAVITPPEVTMPPVIVATLPTGSMTPVDIAVPPGSVLHDFHVIPVAPFSVTGKSTWFGRNPDGSDDRDDMDKQGHDLDGAFGDKTHNLTLVGLSIPIPVFYQSIGRGTTVYDDVKARRWLFDVWCAATGKHVGGVWLVDLGPNAGLNRVMDMTYGLATALGLKDNAICTWACTDTKTGKLVEIKGWDFQRGVVASA